MKRVMGFLMILGLVLAMQITAFAAVDDTGFSDVSMDSWYADAVISVVENDLMGGTAPAVFNPEGNMSRAMLATVLFRIEGLPAVNGTDDFIDTTDGAWYADSVLWASQQGLISGYGDNRFGTDDSVSREQIATILWRYAGMPVSDPGQDFADEDTISSYAGAAVDWARANDVINGKENNCFDPAGNATRAEVAAILYNYMLLNANQVPSDTQAPNETQHTLVVYFSMPETSNPNNMTQEEDNSVVVIDGEVLGNTQYVAYVIQENTGADIFRIEPETPYPTDHDTLVDLAAEEQANDARPALKSTIENLDQYDIIFVGYPNWWGDMPMILYSFFEQYDFAGKTIIPFNTHGGSGFSNTISTIAQLEPEAVVHEDGFTVSRNRVQDGEQDIVNWLEELNL